MKIIGQLLLQGGASLLVMSSLFNLPKRFTRSRAIRVTWFGILWGAAISGLITTLGSLWDIDGGVILVALAEALCFLVFFGLIALYLFGEYNYHRLSKPKPE